MHNKSVGTAMALALLSTTAMAADLPSRRAPPVYVPPPPLPVFSWTGPYVGVHAGYAFGRSTASSFSSATGAGLAAAGGNPDGIIGGAHVGYLFSTQSLPVLGNFNPLGAGGVIGVEGDVDGTNYRSNYALGAITNSTRRDIQGSVRGRLGVAVDRVLFYATGGAAFGGLRNNYFNALNGVAASVDRTRVGWTVGGGIEYAVSNNVSLRAEYRYTDFGTFTDTLPGLTAAGVNVRHRETDNRVQAGISYKFNTFNPAPVVARY